MFNIRRRSNESDRAGSTGLDELPPRLRCDLEALTATPPLGQRRVRTRDVTRIDDRTYTWQWFAHEEALTVVAARVRRPIEERLWITTWRPGFVRAFEGYFVAEPEFAWFDDDRLGRAVSVASFDGGVSALDDDRLFRFVLCAIPTKMIRSLPDVSRAAVPSGHERVPLATRVRTGLAGGDWILLMNPTRPRRRVRASMLRMAIRLRDWS